MMENLGENAPVYFLCSFVKPFETFVVRSRFNHKGLKGLPKGSQSYYKSNVT